MAYIKTDIKSFRAFKLLKDNLFDFLLIVTLGIIFFCILQPLGLIMKLIGYDPLQKKINRKINKSYRENIQKKNIDFNKLF